jgi:hypothetical protein
VKKKWKFRLDSNTKVNLAKYIGQVEECVFIEEINGVVEIVGFIVDGWLHILKGYEWDGCTPKISLFGILVGIPDFRGTWKASLVHDFLIEYCIQHSIQRKKIDIIFQKIMKEERFLLNPIYSAGVHLFRPLALTIGKCK